MDNVVLGMMAFALGYLGAQVWLLFAYKSEQEQTRKALEDNTKALQGLTASVDWLNSTNENLNTTIRNS